MRDDTRLVYLPTVFVFTMIGLRAIRHLLAKKGYVVEFTIKDAGSVQGFRLGVFKEAEKNGAGLVGTTEVADAISSHDGDLVVKLGFESRRGRGNFLHDVTTWCEHHNLEIVGEKLTGGVVLGQDVLASDYVESHTSPPCARARSRRRSSEEVLSQYTQRLMENLDGRAELTLYQNVEEPCDVQMEKCHIIPSPDCRETPLDTDDSNVLALLPNCHKAFDGYSDTKPSWICFSVLDIDNVPPPIQCEGRDGMHWRFRVDLVVQFRKEEFRERHRFCWKEGTRDEEGEPIIVPMYVRDPELFISCVQSRWGKTKKVWDEYTGPYW